MAHSDSFGTIHILRTPQIAERSTGSTRPNIPVEGEPHLKSMSPRGPLLSHGQRTYGILGKHLGIIHLKFSEVLGGS